MCQKYTFLLYDMASQIEQHCDVRKLPENFYCRQTITPS